MTHTTLPNTSDPIVDTPMPFTLYKPSAIFHDQTTEDPPNTSSSSAEDPVDTPPRTIEEWLRRPPSFVFADPTHTMLIWDTEEGGGVITEHSVGQLPMRHAEAVIKVLMQTVAELEKKIQHGRKRQRRAG